MRHPMWLQLTREGLLISTTQGKQLYKHFAYMHRKVVIPSWLELQNTRTTILQRGKTSPTSILYMTLKNLMVRIQLFWNFEECRVPTSLPLLPGPLWSEVVVPDRILFMSQIELNNELMLNRIVWNRTVLTFNRTVLTFNGTVLTSNCL